MTLYFTTINGVDQPAEVTHVVLHLQNRIKELEAQLNSDAADARLTRMQCECLRIGEEIQRAAEKLPAGYDISIDVERGYGSVTLSDPLYKECEFNDTGGGLSQCITQAIDAAIKQGESK